MSTRLTFLIDGFNLYHSLDELEKDCGLKVKWLDLHGVCRSLLASIGSSFSSDFKLCEIFYFTARISHYQSTDPHRLTRQRVYMKAIESTGVKVIEGSFRQKRLFCPKCGQVYRAHEEKMTDVAIACKVLELCHTRTTDAIVLLTGDTDQIPPLNYIRKHFPLVKRIVAFPRGRVNRELRSYVDIDFTLSAAIYESNQLRDVISLPNGKNLTKPPNW